MDESELVGGALFNADDLDLAARLLAGALTDSSRTADAVRGCGLSPVLIEALRASLPVDPTARESACAKGAAWVRGWRAASRADSWELVASLRGSRNLPEGLRRTTAETLVQLIAEAEHNLRLCAPFVDVAGMEAVADAIAAATARGVVVEIVEALRSRKWPEAVRVLRHRIEEFGDPRMLLLSRPQVDTPWPHLKVAVADASVAYIGSANMTGAGLVGDNLELGVLVRGPGVRTIAAILDSYMASA